MLAGDKSLDPPGEFLRVTYPHAKGNIHIEEIWCLYLWKFYSEHIRCPIKLILQLREIPVFWCPRKCRPDGDGPDCHFGTLGEFEEVPIGGSKQGVHSVVFFSPPEGLCLKSRRPLICDQVP